MNITEKMIQAGIDAEAAVLKLNLAVRVEWEPIVRKTVTAALTAALGDVEPLEDGLREVMGEGWTVRQLWPTPKQWHAHVSRVVERGRLDWQNQFGEGTGPTIDAAIRAAVANAKETDQ